jgi:hypothetical protein
MTTTAKTTPFPPVPDVPYVIGIWGGDGLVMHAVNQHAAQEAVARAAGDDPGWARAECDRLVFLARFGGAFARGNEHLDRMAGRLCPYCAWTVALVTSRVDDELAALEPSGTDVPVQRRRLADPGIVRRVCERILATAREDGYLAAEEDDLHFPQVVEQLAYATAHQPVVLLPYECVERECDHGDFAVCEAQTDVVACSACSLQTGEWAGEWAGQYEVLVSAPCSALTAMAQHYGLQHAPFDETTEAKPWGQPGGQLRQDRSAGLISPTDHHQVRT